MICKGQVMPPPTPKNSFLFYPKIHLIVCIYQNKLKRYETFTLLILWTIEIKKYAKYISVYIKVKIVEISKYDLSYMRYYIVITVRELTLNDLKWKSYRLQSFTSHHSLQFWYKVWLHPRSYEKVMNFFCVEPFVGAGDAIIRS